MSVKRLYSREPSKLSENIQLTSFSCEYFDEWKVLIKSASRYTFDCAHFAFVVLIITNQFQSINKNFKLDESVNMKWKKFSYLSTKMKKEKKKMKEGRKIASSGVKYGKFFLSNLTIFCECRRVFIRHENVTLGEKHKCVPLKGQYTHEKVVLGEN